MPAAEHFPRYRLVFCIQEPRWRNDINNLENSISAVKLRKKSLSREYAADTLILSRGGLCI